MARYGAEHKLATRRRILEAAGERLQRDGIDGAGVAVLMKDAGLTNGAFYAHFDSKEHLVAEVVTTRLAAQRGLIASLEPGEAGVVQLVRAYLAPDHRDHPARGCPSAALLDEIARSGDLVREAYTSGLAGVVDDLVARLAGTHPGPPEVLRARVMTAWSLMIGAVQLARALTDRNASDALLGRAVEDVLGLLGLSAAGG